MTDHACWASTGFWIIGEAVFQLERTGLRRQGFPSHVKKKTSVAVARRRNARSATELLEHFAKNFPENQDPVAFLGDV